MSFSNATETEVLAYIFDSAAAAWEANANFWVALHTADPGEAGTATTSEVAYTSYARVAVSRTTGFTVSGNSVENAALIQFGACTAGTNTITHFAVVDTVSGAVALMISGALSASLNVSTGIQPQFAASALSISAD